jgi:hypothetical protein
MSCPGVTINTSDAKMNNHHATSMAPILLHVASMIGTVRAADVMLCALS